MVIAAATVLDAIMSRCGIMTDNCSGNIGATSDEDDDKEAEEEAKAELPCCTSCCKSCNC